MIPESFAMRLCGFFYLFILATNAASVALGNKIDEVDSVAKFRTINDNPNKFRNSIVLALISHGSILALAGLLYYVFSPYATSLAFIGTLFRLGEGLILVYNEITFLALLNVAKKYTVVGDAEKITLSNSGRKILQTKTFRYIVGLNLLAIGTLAYCILFLSSESIPMLIGGLGFTASVISVIGTSIKLAKPNFEILYKIGLPLMMLFEITFGVWLLF